MDRHRPAAGGGPVQPFRRPAFGEPRAAGPAILAVVGAFVYAAVAAKDFFISEQASGEAVTVVHLFDWIPGLGATAELLWDPLAATMTLVVTGVGALIHIYAVGYSTAIPGSAASSPT